MGPEEMAFGYGIATVTADGIVLDTYFHSLGLGALADSQAIDLSGHEGDDPLRKVSRLILFVLAYPRPHEAL